MLADACTSTSHGLQSNVPAIGLTCVFEPSCALIVRPAFSSCFLSNRIAVSTCTCALSRFDSVTYVLVEEAACVGAVTTRVRAGTARRLVEESIDFDARRDACLRADGAMWAMIGIIDVQWSQCRGQSGKDGWRDAAPTFVPNSLSKGAGSVGDIGDTIEPMGELHGHTLGATPPLFPSLKARDRYICLQYSPTLSS